MNDRIKHSMDTIKATYELKNNTCDFMKAEIAKREKKSFSLRRYAVAVCMLLVILVGGFGGTYYLLMSPVSYISMDFNPSVELALNRFDKVINVKSYNQDGEEIIRNLNLKDKYFTAAIDELLSSEKLKSYIKEDSLLTFTVISQKEQAILNELKQCSGYKRYNAACYSENIAGMQTAHENGVSFGKYRAYQELLKYAPDYPMDDFKKLTMSEIQNIIDKYNVDSPPPNDRDDQKGNGNGNGYRGGKD